eukprot:1097652-Pelagomonas_calceolata.AAC.3
MGLYGALWGDDAPSSQPLPYSMVGHTQQNLLQARPHEWLPIPAVSLVSPPSPTLLFSLLSP